MLNLFKNEGKRNVGQHRNPIEQDFEVLDKLKELEKLAGENRNSISILIRIVKGDQEVNGEGLLDKFKKMEKTLQDLKDAIEKPNTKRFKDLPLHQKIIIIVAVIPVFGVNWFELIKAIFNTLEPFMK